MLLLRADASSSFCSFSFVHIPVLRTLALVLLTAALATVAPIVTVAIADSDVNLHIANDETLRYTITQTCPATANPSCVTQVKAIGLFSKYAGKEFQEFVKTLPHDDRPVAIHFSSLGGNLAGGLQVGQLLREYEFITQTGFDESVCYSACAYAFMGGTIRQLGPQEKLGLHQFYSQTNEINASKAQSISALISNYLS
ncbi:hypothetical protein ICV01_04265 [Polynucleobacter sp. MWH-Spelu-300-X4]|uniref:hypothetical protein n=1 Tax=Polynucleobacter sp. MWH-Spelu-300-X4 TaxID=2689109 RepID=UPI001BFE936A|nr:hypothetical protein [Polynucleobacter sp. MWH-Spelu-300-X4]QWD80527.1 hypothetical protein ICV01_04265 [Polynucleobacter sp. MWH-Spelu-300-X4]